MNIEELQEKIQQLEAENKKLKEKLKQKNKRKPIKTTKKEIADYWTSRQEELGLSVDWAEAKERCWRCGYKKTLERCHIIPDSLGGKDTPSNLVLLCKRCHIEAPNVEDKNFMWDWIRAYGTPLYDTFWKIKAQEEYQFIYGKSFSQELRDRDIISNSDLRKFWNTDIGKTSTHYGHPWYNTSTDAGVLKMRLDAYDKKYGNLKQKSKYYREKEEKFESLVYYICELAKKYNWNIWQGSGNNLFSITLSKSYKNRVNKYISIRMCKNDIYKASFKNEINANNIKASEYEVEIGTKNDEVMKLIEKEIKRYDGKYETEEKQKFVYTNNPLYELIYERDNK